MSGFGNTKEPGRSRYLWFLEASKRMSGHAASLEDVLDVLDVVVLELKGMSDTLKCMVPLLVSVLEETEWVSDGGEEDCTIIHSSKPTIDPLVQRPLLSSPVPPKGLDSIPTSIQNITL